MKWFITGGAGFIGSNAAKRCMQEGYEVVIFDNLSRAGSRSNLKWLESINKFEFIEGDIRDYNALKSAIAKHKDTSAILHLAAQVAVTTSVLNPREDFDINALGTFNLLEAVRETKLDPVIIYASTNKVYGSLHDIAVKENTYRYDFENLKSGVSESQNLDFHSPYGCSKGCADQYITDYARIYGLKTVNLRQSCIYGCRQFGIEDQGWVAWFIIAMLTGKPVTVYGNGKQVRDILFADDLIDVYFTAVKNISISAGKTYNTGGGPGNSISLLEFIGILESLMGKKLQFSFADWRPGDQPIFICDITKLKNELGWYPKTTVQKGIEILYNWVKDNLGLFK